MEFLSSPRLDGGHSILKLNLQNGREERKENGKEKIIIYIYR